MTISLQTTTETPPLTIKNNVDLTKLNCSHTRAVSVQYCVLRPKEKDNT